MNVVFPTILIFIIGAFWVIRKYRKKSAWIFPQKEFPLEWRSVLVQKVVFYNALTKEEQKRFEYKVQEFLLNCRVTGIETTIDVVDELLVASSAIIPIFGFDDWKYYNINDVLIYPTTFNRNFETTGPNRNILGMVGSGYMEGIMLLSKQALRHGYTAIHEFIHLIDKADGSIDGIPDLLLEKQYSIPWLNLINRKIDEIYESNSDLNPYGGTNRAEFFCVVSEYFFERPNLLQKRHPELYILLEKIFKQNMTKRNLKKRTLKIGRNSPCPCKSGQKFKKCCGRIHYS